MPKHVVVESSEEIMSGQRSPSKKRKHKETVVSSTDLDTTFSQDDEITFKASQTDINDTQWTEADKEVHIWTIKDIYQLMNKMEEAMLNIDNGTRTCLAQEKVINWEDVKFGRFTIYECKMMWHKIQKKVKRHRTMSEFCAAAKQVVAEDPKSIIKFQKRYTAEELYIDKKLDDYLEANPDTPMTQAVEELKVKYENLSDRRKAKYEKKSTVMKKKVAKSSSNKFPKPPQPVDFYIESKLQSVIEKKPEMTEFQAILYCRNKYKKLKESKQIKYINKCIDHFPSYQEEVKEYLDEHPERDVKISANYINKHEMATKWKFDGIPQKPPVTGYSLFCQSLLKNEDFVNISGKELFKLISDKWKEVPLEEKQKYNNESKELKETYKTEMKEKLLSLPEEERELLTKTVNLPTLESLESSKKKTKLITDFWKPKPKVDSSEMLPVTFPGEPKHKPMNSYAHFVQENIPSLAGHRGSDKLKILGEQWRELSEHEKSKYVEKAKNSEAQYQTDLAEFKESLSKKDLARYEEIVNNRSKKKSKSKKNLTITSNKKADVQAAEEEKEADVQSELENGTAEEDSD